MLALSSLSMDMGTLKSERPSNTKARTAWVPRTEADHKDMERGE